MKRSVIIALFISCLSFVSRSQPYKDSVRLHHESMTRKATLRSAILPGWGQVTNNNLWWIKVSVIYGGFVSLGLTYQFYNKYYHEYLAEAQYRQINNHTPDKIGGPTDGIIRIKDYARRNRDLALLGFAAGYAVNVIEAYVDAMFFRYDIDDDLGVRVIPKLAQYTTDGQPVYSVALAISF